MASELERMMAEALKEAVKLIASEYCSHGRACSATNPECYAQNQIEALNEFERQAEQEQNRINY